MCPSIFITYVALLANRICFLKMLGSGLPQHHRYSLNTDSNGVFEPPIMEKDHLGICVMANWAPSCQFMHSHFAMTISIWLMMCLIFGSCLKTQFNKNITIVAQTKHANK